jgi:uncharacterized protein
MKYSRNLTLTAFFMFAISCCDAQAAMLNEIRIDDAGTDTDEYFEIEGAPGEILNHLTYVVIGDGSGAQGSGVIERVISLAGLTIPSDGYFLAADDSLGTDIPRGAGASIDLVLPGDVFENSDNVTHLLVANFTGAAGTDYDTDDNGVLDSFPWSALLDGLGFVESDPPVSTELNYAPGLGLAQVGPDGAFVPGHAFRMPDHNGDWQIGPFAGDDDTPGTNNIPEPASIALMFASIGVMALRRK